MAILNVLFFLLIGLEYLGVTFQYQELLIGVCALAIGIVGLINLVQQSRG